MDPQAAHERLAGITGQNGIVGPDGASGLKVGGCSPSVSAVFPSTVEEVQEVVRFCAAEKLSVIPVGGLTMTARCARPASYDVALSTSRLTGFVSYEPQDLVLSARGGETGAHIRTALGENRQILALDPPGFENATLGGIVATRASGPARYAHGTPRDLLLGTTVVDAKGDLVRCGSLVMKDVAGYDLSKLYCGSWGTLGVVVEATMKLTPQPETSRLAVALMPSWEAADALVAKVLSSSLLPRSLELLNASAAVAAGIACGDAQTALAAVFDGFEETVDFECAQVQTLAGGCGATDVALYDCPWNSPAHRALADLGSVPPEGSLVLAYALSSQCAPLAVKAAEALAEDGLTPRISAAAGNGVLRIAWDASGASEGDTQTLSRLALALQEASCVACHTAGGAAVDSIWPRQPAGLPIMRAIKAKLDPEGVFPAGKFVGGI